MRRNVALPDITRGDTTSVVEQATGSPDFSGKVATITFKLSPELSDADAALQKSKTLGAEAATGEVAFTLLPTETAALLPTKYFYDIQVAGSAIDVTTAVTGTVKVLADVTHDPIFVPPLAGVEVIETWSTTSFTVEAA